MTEIKVWRQECPYCKKELGISVKKDDKKTDKIYEEHLKTCEEYKKQSKQMTKDLKLIRELQDLGLSMTDIKLLLCEDIEKDIKKLMKKFKIDKEQLTAVIEITITV